MLSKSAQKPAGVGEILEPEVYIVGQLSGGSGFRSDNAFATLKIEAGDLWECVGGELSGQTQSLQGWPRILLEVYALDDDGLRELVGYGFAFIPSTPGHHQLEVALWRPNGTNKEETEGFYFHNYIELLTNDPIYQKAKDERFRMFTTGVGKAIVEIDVILRNLSKHLDT